VPQRRSARRSATAIAAAFVAIAVPYIVISGTMARTSSHDLDELARIERYKGFGFVAVLTLGVYATASFVIRRALVHEHERAGTQAALLSAERRAVPGLFAAGIAHDCRNQLMGLVVELDELGSMDLPTDARAAVLRAQVAVDRVTETLKLLMTAGRDRRGEVRRSVDLRTCIHEALVLVRTHPAVKHCSVEVTGSAEAPIYPDLVHHLVANLVVNAAEATGGQGRIEIRISEAQGFARLEVHDDGPGIPEPERERVFDPFVTTKATGTGLGLYSVRESVRAHEGRIDVGPSPLGGACFRVELPREAASQPAGALAPAGR
jgi:signal transduction histidine kinase